MDAGHKDPKRKCSCSRCASCEASQRLTEVDSGFPHHDSHPSVNVSEEQRDLKAVMDRPDYRHHSDPFIHRFSPEIVFQVFFSFVDASTYNSKCTTSASVREWNPLILLGAVCKDWRDITLRIPELWAKIEIKIPQNASPLWLEIMEAWLSRSMEVPLSLTLRNMDSPQVWNASRILASTNVFRLLRSHSARWQSLDLNFPFSIFHALLDGLDVSYVDRLRITIKHPILSDTESEKINIPGPFTPRNLYIASYSLLDRIPMRWDRLTTLEAHTTDANELLHILQQSIQLNVLKIGTTTRPKRVAGDPYPEPTNPFVMPLLKSLDMTAAYVKCNILWHLTLPDLKNLQWSFRGPSPEVDLNALAELLDRSSPRLENFILICRTSEESRSYSFPDEDSYHKIPGVTHLVIGIHPTEHFIRMGEDFLRPLGTHRQTLTLPRLEVLEVSAPMLSPTSWSYICEIIGPVNVRDGSSSHTSAGPLGPLSGWRPIRKISVNLGVYWSDSQDAVLVDEASYFRLCDIRDSGVDVKVVSDGGSIDVLERYRGIYKSRRPWLSI